MKRDSKHTSLWVCVWVKITEKKGENILFPPTFASIVLSTVYIHGWHWISLQLHSGGDGGSDDVNSVPMT